MTSDLIAADHLRLAAAFLRSGNRDGYEQFRQAQVARLGLTNIASEYWTFKIGLLLTTRSKHAPVVCSRG